MKPKQMQKISKALGDPYRLKILEAIREKQDWLQSIEILEMIHLAQSTVSHHLKQLLDAELLVSEKEGRDTKYRLNKVLFKHYIYFLTKELY